nr:transposase and inactivated derivatives [Bradyrhizobium sp. DOA9]
MRLRSQRSASCPSVLIERCQRWSLWRWRGVAIDGSKFKAVNKRDRNFTRAMMERRRAQLESSIARYLGQLDTAKRQEPVQALAAKVTKLAKKLTKLKDEVDKLAATRSMLSSPERHRGRGRQAGYCSVRHRTRDQLSCAAGAPARAAAVQPSLILELQGWLLEQRSKLSKNYETIMAINYFLWDTVYPLLLITDEFAYSQNYGPSRATGRLRGPKEIEPSPAPMRACGCDLCLDCTAKPPRDRFHRLGSTTCVVESLS